MKRRPVSTLCSSVGTLKVGYEVGHGLHHQSFHAMFKRGHIEGGRTPPPSRPRAAGFHAMFKRGHIEGPSAGSSSPPIPRVSTLCSSVGTLKGKVHHRLQNLLCGFHAMFKRGHIEGSLPPHLDAAGEVFPRYVQAWAH